MSPQKSLPKQDEDATQVDEAEVVERVALIAYDQAAEVAQPREEALHLPIPLVAAQWATFLGLGAFPAAPVRRDHLDPQLHERLVERTSIVGPIPDEPLGQGGYEVGVEGWGDERDLVRCSRGGTSGDWMQLITHL